MHRPLGITRARPGHRADSEGGVPALPQLREEAVRAGPRAAARATRDLRPGCTTKRRGRGGQAGPVGCRPTEGGTPKPPGVGRYAGSLDRSLFPGGRGSLDPE